MSLRLVQGFLRHSRSHYSKKKCKESSAELAESEGVWTRRESEEEIGTVT